MHGRKEADAACVADRPVRSQFLNLVRLDNPSSACRMNAIPPSVDWRS